MNITLTRTCSRCNEIKPHDKEHFPSCGWVCRVCYRARARERKKRNPELLAKTLAAWKAKKTAEDPDYFAQSRREWLKKNPEKMAQYRKNWRINNPESYKIARKRAQLIYQKTISDPKARYIYTVRSAKVRASRYGLTEHFTLDQLLELISTSGNSCYYCGKTLSDDLEIDHMNALSRGGSNTIENVCVACKICNVKKNTKTVKEYFEKMKKDAE